MKFAKLFETEHGQILVKKDVVDDIPVVEIYFQPEGLGVCHLDYKFGDDDHGDDQADAFFDELTQERVIAIVVAVLEKFVDDSKLH